MLFEGWAGRLRLTRNVVIQQDAADGSVAMIISSDDALLTLTQPDSGQPAAQKSVFSGGLKTLESLGRVEVKTPAQTILCDRSLLDMQNKSFLMEMNSPKDEVQLYVWENKEGGKVLLALHSLKYFIDSGELQAGGPQHSKRFTGTPPTNRPAPEKK